MTIRLTDIVRSPRLLALARQGPLAPHLNSFVESVSGVGYKEPSLKDLVHGAIHWGVFLSSRGIDDAKTLRAAHVDAYVATQPTRLYYGKYRYPCSRGVQGARRMMRYLRATGVVAPEPSPPPLFYAPILEEWLTFLERHHGLAPKSLLLYRGHICRFLANLGPDATASGLGRVDPDRIRDFIISDTRNRSRSERKALVSTLRIFLRFVHGRGYTSRDLSLIVQSVPSFKDERLPRGPKWEDTLKLLETPDRDTPIGSRNYAILKILISYGIRAHQVCALRLDDIEWRRGTICFVPMKGGRRVEAPLLVAVSEALIAYLRRDRRPHSDNRHVFVSMHPPFGVLTTAGIQSVVTRAFRQAEIPSPHRGSHALRHAWATRMLATGCSLKAIADLLGHRSLDTTRIYSKVDTTRLQSVALPWPEEVTP